MNQFKIIRNAPMPQMPQAAAIHALKSIGPRDCIETTLTRRESFYRAARAIGLRITCLKMANGTAQIWLESDFVRSRAGFKRINKLTAREWKG